MATEWLMHFTSSNVTIKVMQTNVKRGNYYYGTKRKRYIIRPLSKTKSILTEK